MSAESAWQLAAGHAAASQTSSSRAPMSMTRPFPGPAAPADVCAWRDSALAAMQAQSREHHHRRLAAEKARTDAFNEAEACKHRCGLVRARVRVGGRVHAGLSLVRAGAWRPDPWSGT